MRLYEICDEIERIMAAVDSEEMPEAEANKALDELGRAGDEKLANICGLVKNLEAEEGALEAEIARLRKRAKSVEGRIGWLKGYIGGAIGQGNKWTNGVHKIAWRRSKAVQIFEDLLDGKWWREKVVREPDRLALKAELEAGNQVLGAALEERWNIQVV